MGIVVELHGRQHYKPVNFGHKAMDEVVVDFRNMQYRDNMKMQAALDAGLRYIAIPYTDAGRLTSDKLMKYIEEA